MKTLTKAIKKISISQSVPVNKIFYRQNADHTYTLLDTAHKRIYRLCNNELSAMPFDEEVFSSTFDQGLFGDVDQLIEDLYEEKFGGRKLVNIFRSVNDKIDVDDFKNELSSMLSAKYPNMAGEIEVFVDNNGRDLFRKFKVKFIQDKGKLESDLGNGKGKSKDSKGIFMNMPARPAGKSRKVMVTKSQYKPEDFTADDLFLEQDRQDELNPMEKPEVKSGPPFDYVSLASGPIGEDVVQVTRDGGYTEAMKEECKEFAGLLRRVFPWSEEVGIEFVVKGNPHDFGTYYEVNARVPANSEKSYDYAYWIQDNLPMTWDESTPKEKPVFDFHE